MRSISMTTTDFPYGGHLVHEASRPINMKAYHQAIHTGDASVILNLLHEGCHPDTIQTENGTPALTIACLHHHYSLAQQLIEAGACLENSHFSVLHCLIQQDPAPSHLDFMDFILSKGMNPNTVDIIRQQSCLDFAIEQKKPAYIQLLLRYGARPTELTQDLLTQMPLHESIFYGLLLAPFQNSQHPLFLKHV